MQGLTADLLIDAASGGAVETHAGEGHVSDVWAEWDPAGRVTKQMRCR